MTIDIEKIRELAQKATPGPWVVYINDYDPGRYQVKRDRKDGIFDRNIVQSDHDGGYLKPDDALYIAACDPTTIIALCDEVARLRKQETRLRIGEECHVARPGEGTYECDAQKPCPACRLRSAEAEVERLRAEAALQQRINEAQKP